MSNGKIDLMRLESNRFSQDNGVLSRGPVVTLPVRNSRACNTVTFSDVNTNYLACGLDKVRGDNSLVVWDLETTLPKLASFNSTTVSPTARSSTLPSHSDRTTPRSVFQAAPAETVTSVAFAPSSPSILLAGIGGRFLRLHDIRTPASSPSSVPAKALSIAPDPHDFNRIACVGDGIVSVWDVRRLISPILLFSNADAYGDGATAPHNRTAHGATPAPVAIEWSQSRHGLLAALEREDNYVRFWDVQKTPSDRMTSENGTPRSLSREPSYGRSPRLSWTNASSLMSSWSTTGTSQTAVSGRENLPQNLVLANTWKTRSFARQLASFALIPSTTPHPLASNIMLVNKEGDLEVHALYDTPKPTTWSATGDLVFGAGLQYQVISGSISAGPSGTGHTQGRSSQADHQLDERGRSRRPGSRFMQENGLLSTGGLHASSSSPFPESRSPGGISTATLRKPVSTPNVAANSAHSPKVRAHLEKLHKIMQQVVDQDISMVMRGRIRRGYGLSNPLLNANIANEDPGDDKSLPELWKWIDHSRRILSAPTSQVNGFDFAHQGVMGIWEGLPTIPQFAAPPDVPPPSPVHSVSSSPVMGYRLLEHQQPQFQGDNLLFPSSNVDSGIRRRGKGSSRRNKSPSEAAYGDFHDAIVAVLDRSGIICEKDQPGMLRGSSLATNKVHHRRLALRLCGWTVGDDELIETIKRWEKEGKTSQAACWLVFTNHYGRAAELLMRSKDQTHLMLSGMLTALISLSGNHTKRDEIQKLCERLVLRLEDPYLRAAVMRVLFDEWRDVLDELAPLPLTERLVVALHFLDDGALSSYLRRSAEQCRTDGNIEGLLIAGLTPMGLGILQSWLDRSGGDVQSAALLGALVVPARIRHPGVERWITAYRDLLDSWKMFHERVAFDIERGDLARRTTRTLAGAGAPPPQIEWAPKQIIIRCNYCNKPITAPESPMLYNGKPTTCTSCDRALPRCSVCLTNLCLMPDSVRYAELAVKPQEEDTFEEALIICQTCRHGGHAAHIMEWFFGSPHGGGRPHPTCAVADCVCRCADEM